MVDWRKIWENENFEYIIYNDQWLDEICARQNIYEAKNDIVKQKKLAKPYESFGDLYKDYFHNLSVLSRFYHTKESELGGIYYDSEFQRYLVVTGQFPDSIQLNHIDSDIYGNIISTGWCISYETEDFQKRKEDKICTYFTSYDLLVDRNYPYAKILSLNMQKIAAQHIIENIDGQLKTYEKLSNSLKNE